jgi:hypothetical protein
LEPCDPDWIQTSDLLLRRQLLYSAELPDRFLKQAQIYHYWPYQKKSRGTLFAGTASLDRRLFRVFFTFGIPIKTTTYA